ncbi:hypothetical protein FGO68_gene14195 [Halteria grandinella]|uniref:Uncharacterized protein n=1 Tax=Halteria grandinella TaxID=5974 RepID=A0A8J8P5C4_HALGN|nr:hypothetical protein FGO68_gene14195 [Halteria grandinella]
MLLFLLSVKFIISMESSEQAPTEEKQYDIKDHCELCKAFDCCPEHCCDWDHCSCATCRPCMLRREEARLKQLKEIEAAQDQQQERKLGHSQSIRILAKETQQEVKKVNTNKKKVEDKKKQPKGYMDFDSSDDEKKKKTDDDDEDESEEEDDKPHEKIKLKDGACIINYEVEVEKEEEEEQVYAGGLKGIRALKKQQREFD